MAVNYGGTGPMNRTVTLSRPNNNGLSLCVLAMKLDGSNAMLTLVIYTGNNPLGGHYYNTSAPYGTTEACGGVVP